MQGWMLFAVLTYMAVAGSAALELLTSDDATRPRSALPLAITLWAIAPLATSNYQGHPLAETTGIAAAAAGCVATGINLGLKRRPKVATAISVAGHGLMVAAAYINV